jgi:predicted small secreted protein
MKRIIFAGFALIAAAFTLAACDDAHVASQNLSKAADNFEINRRIIFYNGVTGEYMLTIEGLCSQEPDQKKLAVICKTGPGTYKKHFLGLSDNVTYFSEQLEPARASVYMYRVTFKPSVIVPDIRVQ